jgi:phosphoribosylformylglycinamidine synthase
MINPLKVLVLYGYGLNCDWETQFALNLAGAAAERVHVNELISGAVSLTDYYLLAVPGGFSWGDDHGAGVILGLRLKLALQKELEEFIQAGKLIIGICNGFQVLVNMGLLPGLDGNYNKRQVALIPNDCGNFRDAWVSLHVPSSNCIFTRGIQRLELPIRHGEGKFYASEAMLDKLSANHQVALQYAAPDGAPAQGQFPNNPNGSLHDIAGICDASGRVLGLMPHPEAHITALQHPTWTRQKETWRRQHLPYPVPEGTGLKIFRNAVDYLRETIL